MMKKAFTLLEVIIVIIIIGVLASLALPRLFKVIEASQATEALVTIATIRSAMERSYLMNNGRYFSVGGTVLSRISGTNMLDIEYPENSPNAHFSYLVVASTDGESYCILATNQADNAKMIAFGYNRTVVARNPFPCGSSGSAVMDWDATDPYQSVIPK